MKREMIPILRQNQEWLIVVARFMRQMVVFTATANRFEETTRRPILSERVTRDRRQNQSGANAAARHAIIYSNVLCCLAK